MAKVGWDVDQFTLELTATLVDVVGSSDFEGLKRAVALSADTAETVCRDRPMACGAGCPYCCVLNVSILLPEGIIIAQWLQQQLAAEEYAVVRERIAAHRRRVRWMDDEERIFANAACPLLDPSGSCSIYPVRPLVCRGPASLDRNSCREAFRPMDVDAERLVPADLLRQAAFDAAFMAFAQALRHHGLDDRSIEMGAGVLGFMDHPEYLERLLDGERLPQAMWE